MPNGFKPCGTAYLQAFASSAIYGQKYKAEYVLRSECLETFAILDSDSQLDEI